MATQGATNSQEEGVFATSRATTGSSNTGSSSSTTPGSSSSSTTGTGTANNNLITVSAGTGIDGGGSFTLNQAEDATIPLSLSASGVTANTYTVTNIQTLTVDASGRLTAINEHAVTPTSTFSPGESNRINTGSTSYRGTTGGSATGSVSTSTTTLTVETDVDTGFTVDSTNYRKETSSTNPDSTVDSDGTVTIPPNSMGTTDVGGEVTVTGPNSMGITETETVSADPVSIDTYIPYYFGFMATETTLSGITGLTASDAAIATGDSITVVHPDPGNRQYAYLALPTSIGTPTFTLSLFEVTADDGGSFSYAGVAYTVYRFPSNGNLILTVTF